MYFFMVEIIHSLHVFLVHQEQLGRSRWLASNVWFKLPLEPANWVVGCPEWRCFKWPFQHQSVSIKVSFLGHILQTTWLQHQQKFEKMCLPCNQRELHNVYIYIYFERSFGSLQKSWQTSEILIFQGSNLGFCHPFWYRKTLKRHVAHLNGLKRKILIY